MALKLELGEKFRLLESSLVTDRWKLSLFLDGVWKQWKCRAAWGVWMGLQHSQHFDSTRHSQLLKQLEVQF